MKKFLTVLLVIAVMFTFSFSSAFAYNATGTAKYDEGLASTYFDSAIKSVDAGDGFVSVDEYNVSTDVLKAFKSEILALVKAEYTTDNTDEKAGYPVTASDFATLLGTVDASNTDLLDLQQDLMAAQYALDEADAIAAFANLNIGDYSTEKMSTGKISSLQAATSFGSTNADFNGATYQEFVQYLIDKAVAAIEDENVMKKTSPLASYTDALNNINKYIEAVAPVGTTNGDNALQVSGTDVAASTKTDVCLVTEKAYVGKDNKLVGLGVYEINPKFLVAGGNTLDTFKETTVNNNKAVDAADIATVKATIAKAYANAVVGTGLSSSDKEAMADLKTVLDKLADEEVVTNTNLNTFKTCFTKGSPQLVNAPTAVANVEAIVAYAEKMANEKDENGKLVRDAADVQDIVDAYTVWRYAQVVPDLVGAVGATATETNVRGLISGLYITLADQALTFEKASYVYFISEVVAAAEYDGTYYAPELAKVKALAEEYTAKVNAVTEFKTNGSDNLAVLYKKFNDAVKAVKTKDDVDKLTAASGLYGTAKSYLDIYNKSLKGDNKYYDETVKLEKEVKKMVGATEARTNAEIAALSSQLPALVQALPTKGAVDAAKDAAEKAVEALPSKIAIADRATVEAAIAATKEYNTLSADTYGADAVTTAITKLAYAYKNDFDAKYKALDKKDKEAVKALKAEIKQFCKDFPQGAKYAKVTSQYTTTSDAVAKLDVFKKLIEDLDGDLQKIQDTEYDAVTKLINAIPVNVNDADVAAVKAAREAYDTYVAYWTSVGGYLGVNNHYNGCSGYDMDGFAADDFTGYADMVRAEANLGLTDLTQVSVETLKITAKSVAKKGYIKVSWTVKGDAAAADGYQIYRSTKANKGFKKAFTTAKKTYKNTKVTKGTRYYYKVRAYKTVDGVKYYSDWSNKAYRVAK